MVTMLFLTLALCAALHTYPKRLVWGLMAGKWQDAVVRGMSGEFIPRRRRVAEGAGATRCGISVNCGRRFGNRSEDKCCGPRRMVTRGAWRQLERPVLTGGEAVRISRSM